MFLEKTWQKLHINKKQIILISSKNYLYKPKMETRVKPQSTSLIKQFLDCDSIFSQYSSKTAYLSSEHIIKIRNLYILFGFEVVQNSQPSCMGLCCNFIYFCVLIDFKT